MTTRYIIGNWKMDPSTLERAEEIFKGIKKHAKNLKHSTVGICPPTLYFERLQKIGTTKDCLLGLQNIHYENDGAHTGEISIPMAKDAGASYLIIGHSERRSEFGETDALVNKKVKAAVKAQLRPIVCVGESERDEEGSHFGFVEKQIKDGLSGITRQNMKNILVAYEPVWAIGAKDAMDAYKLREMAIFIRRVISDISSKGMAESVPVLYGGSVNPTNVKDLMSEGGVDGLLIGRASREPEKMRKIIEIVDKI